MKQNMKRLTLAASTFVVAALLSFGWSDQSGISLSVEKAEARVGRPLTPVSVAGVARRQYRRAAIGTAAVGAAAWGAGYAGTLRGSTAAPFAEPRQPTMAVPHMLPEPLSALVLTMQ